jgi:AcrR family transcriptional regulator
MMSEVKRPDRRAERQRLITAASRRDILEAAHRLFLERGYAATTIPAIAAAADVAVQTIYNTVGGKRAVLGGVIELAVRGPGYPATVSETFGAQLRAERDAARILELFSDWLARTHARTAAISAVIRDAAGLDAEVAELEQTLAEKRLAGYREVADELARRDGLRSGTTPDEAAATIWSLGHPDTYRFLRHQQGWTAKHYRRWLQHGLQASLAVSS